MSPAIPKKSCLSDVQFIAIVLA